MTDADRDKWNRRYAEGAYRARKHPSALLQTWLPRLRAELMQAGRSPPRALDVACGAGRNALFLAAHGFRVEAVDISAEALARARSAAAARGVDVRFREHDLDHGLPGPGAFDLIVVFRYVNLPLLRSLPDALARGGFLLCEQHLVTDAEVVGPREPSFRVAPGLLPDLVPELEVCASDELITSDPDGAPVALARLIARKR